MCGPAESDVKFMWISVNGDLAISGENTESNGMNTYLVGSFGEHNGGDDAFVEVALDGLARYCKPSKVIAHSRTPLSTSRGVVKPEVTRRYFKGQNSIQRFLNTRNLSRILYAGGGIHTDANVLRGQRRILERNPECLSAAVGVSVWPLKDQVTIDECRRLLEKFSFIGVRGRASFERLRQMDVQARYELTFDIAVLLRVMMSQSHFQVEHGNRSVGVSLRACDQLGPPNLNCDEKRINFVAAILNELIEGNKCSVHLIDFCSHREFGDYDILERLRSKLLNGVPIYHERYDDDPIGLLKRVMRVNCMIAMRLHAAVFAYTCNIPCLFLPYEDKCLEWADMAGLPGDDVVDPVHGSVHAYARRLSAMLANKKGNAMTPLSAAIKAAQRNWDVLAELGF